MSKTEFSRLNEDGGAAGGAAGGVAGMNTAGGGAVAGIGVGPQGEPGVNRKKKLSVVIADALRRKPPAGLENA